MISLLIGLVVLVVVVQVLRWFARADVKAARKAINWTGVVLIGAVILFLVATGRMAGAIAGLMALAAWGFRLLSIVQMGRQFTGMFRSFGFGRGAAGGAQSSQVDSAFLHMRLDLNTGAMEGEVIQGRFQGRRLVNLDLTDLLALLQEVTADADSVGLLEAYLDRAHPDWRESGGTDSRASGAAPSSPSAMTTDEAYRILGLKPGADTAEIKVAYRRLMAQLHPDHGGSDYLAAKVNLAKDFLLKQ
jgi:DnaJ-domain-containing protein 1